MEASLVARFSKLSLNGARDLQLHTTLTARVSFHRHALCLSRNICIEHYTQTTFKRRNTSHDRKQRANMTPAALKKPSEGICVPWPASAYSPTEAQLPQEKRETRQVSREILGVPASPSNRNCDSFCTFTTFSDGTTQIQSHTVPDSFETAVDWEDLGIPDNELPEKLAWKEIYLRGAEGIAEPTLTLDQLCAEDREVFEGKLIGPHCRSHNPNNNPSKRFIKKQTRIATKKGNRKTAIATARSLGEHNSTLNKSTLHSLSFSSDDRISQTLMTPDPPNTTSEAHPDIPSGHNRPLVVGLTKPSSQQTNMASSEEAAALNREIQKSVSANTKSAAPAEEVVAESAQPKQKKEKAPKQPKPPKAAPAAAPTSPALIDLRVGHILRAIAHPNADSLYVSTIAMGDPEGTEHTQVDEETGKIVRTVCSGLNGLVPLAEMQDRRIIVVANLKPVNMRSIKSAAMVLAASPKQEEGADPHAPDRVVELVIPPEGSEAGDKVYFEGWPYGDGKGPEKQLNPKKKQWEAIQPGFYTSEDLVVGFDASKCDEVSGSDKGTLVVEGKGPCKVKTLKGAVVR